MFVVFSVSGLCLLEGVIGMLDVELPNAIKLLSSLLLNKFFASSHVGRAIRLFRSMFLSSLRASAGMCATLLLFAIRAEASAVVPL